MNARARIVGRRRALSTLAAGILAVGAFPTAARAGQVQQITNFGTNPTNIGMYLYTPSTVSAKPAVLVGIHACHGKGMDVCANGTAFAAQSDKYGFCWCVRRPSAATAAGMFIRTPI